MYSLSGNMSYSLGYQGARPRIDVLLSLVISYPPYWEISDTLLYSFDSRDATFQISTNIPTQKVSVQY